MAAQIFGRDGITGFDEDAGDSCPGSGVGFDGVGDIDIKGVDIRVDSQDFHEGAKVSPFSSFWQPFSLEYSQHPSGSKFDDAHLAEKVFFVEIVNSPFSHEQVKETSLN